MSFIDFLDMWNNGRKQIYINSYLRSAENCIM